MCEELLEKIQSENIGFIHSARSAAPQILFFLDMIHPTNTGFQLLPDLNFEFPSYDHQSK